MGNGYTICTIPLYIVYNVLCTFKITKVLYHKINYHTQITNRYVILIVYKVDKLYINLQTEINHNFNI